MSAGAGFSAPLTSHGERRPPVPQKPPPIVLIGPFQFSQPAHLNEKKLIKSVRRFRRRSILLQFLLVFFFQKCTDSIYPVSLMKKSDAGSFLFLIFFFQVQWHPEILDNGFSKSLIDKEVERWLVSFPLKPSHNLRKPSKTR